MYAMKLAVKTQRLGSSLVRWLALFRLSPLGLPYVRRLRYWKTERQALEYMKIGPVIFPHSSTSLRLTFIKSTASFASLSKKSSGKSRSGGLDCPYPRGSQATTVKRFLFRFWSCGAKSVLPLPENSHRVTFWMFSVSPTHQSEMEAVPKHSSWFFLFKVNQGKAARADSTQRRISTPRGVRTGLWAPPSDNFEEARLRTRIFVARLTAFQCSSLLPIHWRN